MPVANFSNTTPAAPIGNTNITWQSDGSGNISGYLSTPTAAWQTYTPTLGSDAGTFSATTWQDTGYLQTGNIVFFTLRFAASLSATATYLYFGLPPTSQNQPGTFSVLSAIIETGPSGAPFSTCACHVLNVGNGVLRTPNDQPGQWPAGAYQIMIAGFYRAA